MAPSTFKLTFVGMAVLTWRARYATAFSEAGTEVGQCEFADEPLGVGYFWDPTCKLGMLGCNADGRNMACRFCGAGDFLSVDCPASTCKFPNNPFVSYHWDPDCEMGKLGCWADGIHAQCRFCGRYPYTSLPCPEGAAPPNGAACTFENEPAIPYYWEPGCKMGMHGCNADGVNVHCRYCGGGDFWDVDCPAEQVCQFANKPSTPYYWDPTCKDDHGLGCNADGIHVECRFCAQRPFEDVPCPEAVAPPENVCTWPLRGEPEIPYYWEPLCQMGILGCWADGIHAGCRFCGAGVFKEIPCPNATALAAGETPLRLALAHAGMQAAGSRSKWALDISPLSNASEPEDDVLGAAMPLASGFGLIVSVLTSF